MVRGPRTSAQAWHWLPAETLLPQMTSAATSCIPTMIRVCVYALVSHVSSSFPLLATMSTSARAQVRTLASIALSSNPYRSYFSNYCT